MMERLRRFMLGRYGGSDTFNLFLLALGLVCSLLGAIFFLPLYFLADILYIYALFRVFSRNIPARQRENYAFQRFWRPIGGWLGFQRRRFAERKVYKYFKCPSCKQKLRAPRGRGEIEVTCQKCHTVFRKKC